MIDFLLVICSLSIIFTSCILILLLKTFIQEIKKEQKDKDLVLINLTAAGSIYTFIVICVMIFVIQLLWSKT